MPPPSGFKITTELLWQSTLSVAIFDLVLVSLLVWRLKPGTFRQLQAELIVTTALFWLGLWFWVIAGFWELVYQYLFPAWSRWIMPFFQAVLTAFIAALAWRFSWRVKVNPVLSYCLMGGLWGLLSHIWAVQIGVVDKPPILQGAAPLSAVVFAIFEFIFYWCSIILIAWMVYAIRRWLSSRNKVSTA